MIVIGLEMETIRTPIMLSCSQSIKMKFIQAKIAILFMLAMVIMLLLEVVTIFIFVITVIQQTQVIAILATLTMRLKEEHMNTLLDSTISRLEILKFSRLLTKEN